MTIDEHRQESWVYDRFSTETVYSTSSGGISALILGGGLIGTGALGGGVGGGVSQSAGARSTIQRNLTVIVKFDGAHRVRDFSYRQSSFQSLGEGKHENQKRDGSCGFLCDGAWRVHADHGAVRGAATVGDGDAGSPDADASLRD